MFRKAVLTIICAVLLWQAFSLFNEALAQAQDRLVEKESFWSSTWKWLKDHTFAFSIILVTLITISSTVMAMLSKDKLLKGIAGHLVTIELKGDQPGSDGERHRGRLRVESEGIEVVEEQVNKSNEKMSYLLRKDEYKNTHAIIRYHDFLTDREKEEREAEVDRVYHPSIGMRLRRRMRNIVNEMKRVATETFNILFSKVKQQFTVGDREYGKEIEKAGEEAVGYATEASYDALIDRLIGTRVVVHLKPKLEYVGVLKDYTSQFIELLDVKYKNSWQTLLEKKKGFSRAHRGLTLKRKGDDVTIRSKSPFRVRLRHLYWEAGEGGRPNAKRENINKMIEPFGELKINLSPSLDVVVKPFERLQLPTRYFPQDYKKILINFESVRIADVVLQKSYGLVRHRTEKYEAKILDFGALAEALLTTKGEELVLESGDAAAAPLSVYNGYLTNLPRERMDVVAVGEQINQRWTVGNFFTSLDKKLRPISNHHFLGLLPLFKPRKIIALFALISMLHTDDDKKKKARLLPLAYFSLCSANSKKRCRAFKKQVLIKKKKRRLFGFITRPSQV